MIAYAAMVYEKNKRISRTDARLAAAAAPAAGAGGAAPGGPSDGGVAVAVAVSSGSGDAKESASAALLGTGPSSEGGPADPDDELVVPNPEADPTAVSDRALKALHGLLLTRSVYVVASCVWQTFVICFVVVRAGSTWPLVDARAPDVYVPLSSFSFCLRLL